MKKLLTLTTGLVLVLALLATMGTQLISSAPLAQEQRLATTITVTSTADSGPGTLRQALLDAVNGDTITFDPTVFPPDAPATITLTSPLPDITQGNLTIDASDAGVILDGSGLGSGNGFLITSDGNVIQGLQILYFPAHGVQIGNGASYNLIGGDTAGERNLISGNVDNGVYIEGSGTTSNTVSGNYIGTDVNGTAAIPNANTGVYISDGASYNLIGGDTTGERNLISGNGGNGVHIESDGTMSNTVRGNYIGLDLDGARQAFPADTAISPNYGSDCTLYVATLSTGIHKSTDCGDTWAEVNNGLTESRLIQIKIPPDATDADTAYVLAENGYLFVTTDGGANWSLVSTALEGIDRRNLVLSAGFGTDQTMYAAAKYGSSGVFRSTDGGVTWMRMVNGMSDDNVWKVIASPDPAEKETLFALTRSGVEKSTDGGASWATIISPDTDLSDLALSPAYASDQTLFVTANTGRVYSSTNGGISWSGANALVSDPRLLSISPDYPSDQTVCHGRRNTNPFYCSTDGGITWTEIDAGLLGWLNDAGTGILFSPDYPIDPTIFVASVAGMARSETGLSGGWELLRGLRDLGHTTGVVISGGASHNTLGPDNIISNNHRAVSIYNDTVGELWPIVA